MLLIIVPAYESMLSACMLKMVALKDRIVMGIHWCRDRMPINLLLYLYWRELKLDKIFCVAILSTSIVILCYNFDFSPGHFLTIVWCFRLMFASSFIIIEVNCYFLNRKSLHALLRVASFRNWYVINEACASLKLYLW